MNQTLNKKMNNGNPINNMKIRNNQSSTSTSSSSSSSSTSGYSGSNVFGIVLLLVVVLVLISASYWLYNYYSTQLFMKPQEVDAMPDVKNASSNFTVASGTIPNSNYSNEYSISCWINILDYNYNYGKEKVILRRGAAGSGNPEIVLAAKTNDLIVRLKLQGNENSVAKFVDIPIDMGMGMNMSMSPSMGMPMGMPMDMPMDMAMDMAMDMPISPSMSMAMDMDMGISPSPTLVEKFNITSTPLPVKFKNNSNYDELINKTKIGENEVDFPTIQYVSNNSNFNDKYFSMISGNTLSNTGNTTNTDNNTVEKFDDITDATNAIIDVLVDICDITNYIQNTSTSDSFIDSINLFFNTILEYIENIRSLIKSGSGNIETINTSFQLKMDGLSLSSNNGILEAKMNKLKVDTDKLNEYKSVVIEYSVLKNAVNSKMKLINCPLTFDGTTEEDGSLSFLENFIKLLKTTLNNFLSNLSKSINKSSSCNNDMDNDPTVGTCVVKMIPLQKWVSVIVSVYNQVVDIYIDGQLASSCVLKKFPALSTTDVQITPDGGFSGMISRVKFTNTAMTIQQAKSIYYDGPIVSSTLFSMIPNWVYWSIFIIIVIAILYSFLV